MPYLRHLSGSADLITASEEIRAGFVALALKRSRQATPFGINRHGTPLECGWTALKVL